MQFGDVCRHHSCIQGYREVEHAHMHASAYANMKSELP